MNPNRQKNETAMAMAPAENLAMAKTLTSSRGSGVRSSTRTKVPRMTAAAAKHTSVVTDDHPHCGPWMMARTSKVTPRVEMSTPRVSKRCRWGRAIFGMRI